ncbi:MAG: hypothetical protein M1816_004605 [Peltula sp. TS41687]|nr:MAG: hypothetical protein M1816_004605 [Peltula sp. TS41687]
MAPRATPAGHTPHKAQINRAPSPNYFGLVPDYSHDPANSSHALGVNQQWASQSPAVRSVAAVSPKVIPIDPRSSFETFRRQSEGKTTTVSLPRRSHPAPTPGGNPFFGEGGDERMIDRENRLGSPAIPSDPAVPGGDRMDVDSPDLRRPFFSQRSSRAAVPPILEDAPRIQSPETFPSQESPGMNRPSLSHFQEHHQRLSLPGDGAHSPSSEAVHTQRASTLPTSMSAGGPTLIAGQELAALLRSSVESVLLLDVRVAPQFSQSRISGALNLCIPTTLLKRPSFNAQKLAETFTKTEDRKIFDAWKTSQFLVVYDDRSWTIKDAVLCVSTLKKFLNEGWQGRACVLRGGFTDFSQQYPQCIDKSINNSSPQASATKNLSMAGLTSSAAPVAGGCPMPSSKSSANPFFGNIRQNMDLIGGVGQIPIKRPSGLTQAVEANLPGWLRRAITVADQGKAVAARFLQIEQAEQRRMQKALSGKVIYGEPTQSDSQSFSIAGIEKGTKNRYNNIWPYDHARVKLQDLTDGTCDYINASYIKTPWSNKRYIATQGPMPTTFRDFWNVVWEQDVRLIVMLTAEQEGGQLKCHPYWTGRDFGPLRLKPISEQKVALEISTPGVENVGHRRSTSNSKDLNSPRSPTDPGIPHAIVRKFSLSHTSLPFHPLREITQLQFAAWPDFDVPTHPRHLLALIENCDAVVRTSMSPTLAYQQGQPSPLNQRPVLVHCSAGCGRTGAFCTVDSVLDMLKRQRSEELGRGQAPPLLTDASGGSPSAWLRGDDDLIAKAVEQFRGQRISMVQSLRQFALCYEAVLEWFVAQHHQASSPRSPRERKK